MTLIDPLASAFELLNVIMGALPLPILTFVYLVFAVLVFSVLVRVIISLFS